MLFQRLCVGGIDQVENTLRTHRLHADARIGVSKAAVRLPPHLPSGQSGLTQPGILITFFQFLFTASATYTTQFSPGSPYTVRPPKVPLQRWAFIAAMFFTINMLNNWAVAFSISVPVHIILRSFGSVTTMMAGVVRGKRYSLLQVLSVLLLTFGVLVSAWADSESKVRWTRRIISTIKTATY